MLFGLFHTVLVIRELHLGVVMEMLLTGSLMMEHHVLMALFRFCSFDSSHDRDGQHMNCRFKIPFTLVFVSWAQEVAELFPALRIGGLIIGLLHLLLGHVGQGIPLSTH